jgi:hypothetical protein
MSPFVKSLLLVPAALIIGPFALGGCGLGRCVNVDVTSERSSGSSVVTVANLPARGSTSTTVDLSSLNLTIGWSEAGMQIAFDTTGDAAASAGFGSVIVTVAGAVDGQSVALSEGSEVCATGGMNDGESLCYALTGTVTTSTYSTVCPVNGQECALTVVGSLKATADWGGGSLALDLTLNHVESASSETCPMSEGS